MNLIPVNIVSSVESIISNMRYNHAISSITTVAAGSIYKINTNETHDISAGKYVTIGGVSYKVLSVVNNVSFNVSSTSLPSGTIWYADYPYFYYGTPVQVEVKREKDKIINKLKYPFISLFMPVKSDIHPEDEILSETASLWIIFMDDNSGTTQDNYQANIIMPMNDLLYRFIAQCKKESSIVDIQNIVTNNLSKTEYSNYGLVARISGFQDMVILERLGGVEVENFNLPLLKAYSC